MLITKLYERINDLYENYREIESKLQSDKAKRLIDDSLYFCSEMVEIIEQLESDELKNN